MPNPQKGVCLLIDIKFDNPTGVYSLCKPVKSKVFNFNELFLI